jgi:hypothetical protein
VLVMRGENVDKLKWYVFYEYVSRF